MLLAGGDPDFMDELALEPVGPATDAGRRFRGRMTARFAAPIQPQGGVTSALAVHAAALVLARPDQHLRSLSTVFAGQVPPGPVDVDVEVLRVGRSASQLRATVRPSDGDPAGHAVQMTFVADRPSPVAYTDAVAPVAPPPDDCIDRWELEAPDHAELVGPRPPFFEHFESRLVSGHVPWDPPWEPISSEVVSWMRWHDTPCHADGTPSSLALIPPCDTMPGAVWERLGPTDGNFLVPSVDLTVHVFDTDIGPRGWLLRRNTSRWAGHGLAEATMELYRQDGRPLAVANQLMHIRPIDRETLRARVEASAAGLGGQP